MKYLFLFLFLSCCPAQSAEKMFILNDQEQAAFMAVLDAATRAQGLQIADVTIHLRNKLNGAMVIMKKEDIPTPAPVAPSAEPKP